MDFVRESFSSSRASGFDSTFENFSKSSIILYLDGLPLMVGFVSLENDFPVALYVSLGTP
ncbi:MAG: hypothetical protein JO327_11625 [Nitrososphaeraceae archaeon]|nr:hypothetical protein [Nitrososphaeraceae archaeon]